MSIAARRRPEPNVEFICTIHWIVAPPSVPVWMFTGFRVRSMILIGQYDSPFVRRVGIALTLYGFAFEHKPWSTFGDADKIRPYNPLTRVPTLVLDDGEVLIDSTVIL